MKGKRFTEKEIENLFEGRNSSYIARLINQVIEDYESLNKGSNVPDWLDWNEARKDTIAITRDYNGEVFEHSSTPVLNVRWHSPDKIPVYFEPKIWRRPIVKTIDDEIQEELDDMSDKQKKSFLDKLKAFKDS